MSWTKLEKHLRNCTTFLREFLVGQPGHAIPLSRLRDELKRACGEVCTDHGVCLMLRAVQRRMPPGLHLRILKKSVLVFNDEAESSARRGLHRPGAKPTGASVPRPDFLAALEELEYPESAGLSVLRGMEV